MRFALFVLGALPGALAARAYSAPASFLAKVEADDSCDLPDRYHVKNFSARTNDSGATLASYKFTFLDTTYNLTSLCQYNSSSVSTTPEGMTPRFACENRNVKFIWRSEQKDLTLIQRVCPSSDGVPEYEVSGSVDIFLACTPATSRCVSNSTDYSVLYTSLSPVRDPTSLAESA